MNNLLEIICGRTSFLNLSEFTFNSQYHKKNSHVNHPKKVHIDDSNYNNVHTNKLIYS